MKIDISEHKLAHEKIAVCRNRKVNLVREKKMSSKVIASSRMFSMPFTFFKPSEILISIWDLCFI